MKLKKAISLILILSVISAIALTGCAAKESSQDGKSGETAAQETSQVPAAATTESTETKEAEKPVTLDFWTYPKWNGVTGTEKDGQPGDWEKAMAQKFSEENPHVSINVEVLDFKSGPQKVSISLAAGTIPDVLHDSESRMFEYSNMGYILPLNDYLDEEYVSDFYEGVLETTSIGDGKYYYLPIGTAPIMMMVNKSLFKKAGTENLLPQNSEKTWTLDEYYNAVKTTTSKLPGVYAAPLFGDTSTGDAFTFIWIWASGGRIVSNTMDKIAINEEKAINGLKFWKKLIDEKLAAPGGAGLKAPDVWPLFDQQKVLTAPAATVNYARAVKAQEDGNAEKFEIELVSMPNAPGEKVVSSGFPHGFAVFKSEDANEQKWSVEFAKFLCGKENAGIVKAANEFSFRKSQAGMYDDSTDPNMKFASTALKYQISNGTAAVGYTQLRNAITPHLQAYYLGNISVEEFVTTVETEGNKILADAREQISQN